MKRFSLLLLLALAGAALADTLFKNAGSSIGPVKALNCAADAGITCARTGSTGGLSCNPASPTERGCVKADTPIDGGIAYGAAGATAYTAAGTGFELLTGSASGIPAWTGTPVATRFTATSGTSSFTSSLTTAPLQISSSLSAASADGGTFAFNFKPVNTLPPNSRLLYFSGATSAAPGVWSIDYEGDVTQSGGLTLGTPLAVTSGGTGGTVVPYQFDISAPVHSASQGPGVTISRTWLRHAATLNYLTWQASYSAGGEGTNGTDGGDTFAVIATISTDGGTCTLGSLPCVGSGDAGYFTAHFCDMTTSAASVITLGISSASQCATPPKGQISLGLSE